MPFVALLAGCLFMILGLSYTVRRTNMEQLTFFFTLGVTPMFLFSGVFFPLDGLPPLVRGVAWLSPLYHLVEVVRALTLGRVGLATAGHVAWMLAVLALAWGIPGLALRKRLRT